MKELITKIAAENARRDFLKKSTLGIGAFALSFLAGGNTFTQKNQSIEKTKPSSRLPHFLPRVKRVIYLFQSGGPSQMELFDYKPKLTAMAGKEIPDSVRGNQRLSGMVSSQASFPLAGSFTGFKQYGKNGIWVSDLLPHTAKVVDDLCIIKSMYTEAINHEPALLFMQTGSQQSGRPSIGSWLSYGLGSENENLPAFVVLISKGQDDQPLNSSVWGNGFLSSYHQGVQFRAGKEPVLYLNNPDGLTKTDRRTALNYLSQIDSFQKELWGNPEIDSKINQYELAFRMQTSVPQTMDVTNEPDHIFDLYGEDARIPGTYAANCLLARRLAEKDVRFIQLYHMGWDQHNNLPEGISKMTRSSDKATAALIQDLKQRGLLDDTLVIWGGEFGRTSFSQGQLTKSNYGRDHHPRCFTMFMAGAGVKSGITYGETDDFSYNIVKDGVHIHDFQATLLHLMGIDHERLTFKYQGRRFRLTDVHGKVVENILA